MGSIIIPILQLRTLWHREVTEPAQGHTARTMHCLCFRGHYKPHFQISRKQAWRPPVLRCLDDIAVKGLSEPQGDPSDFHPGELFPDHQGNGM